ncbi:MAG: hypothetical protein WCR30_04845 [Clostridia bacterium]
MKKIFALCLTLICPFLVLAGCEEEIGNYWSDTYTKLSEMIVVSVEVTANEQAIAKVVSKDYEITFAGNASFTDACTNNDSYKELAIYQNLLKTNLRFINEYLAELDFTPTLVPEDGKKTAQKEFAKFNDKIDVFKAKVSEFLIAKQQYEQIISRTDFNVLNNSSTQFLKEFKKSYAKIISEAKEFNNSFISLFVGKYIAKPAYVNSTGTITPSMLRIINILSQKVVAESMTDFIIAKNEGNNISSQFENSKNVFSSSLEISTSSEILNNMAQTEGIKTRYNSLVNVLNSVVNEKNCIIEMLENFDINGAIEESSQGKTEAESVNVLKLNTMIDYFTESLYVLITNSFIIV